jgi:hypothetical protein
MIVVIGLIFSGLLGASLFASGMIFNMPPLVIAGITITAIQIIGMGILYLCGKKPQSQLQTQSQSQNPVLYSSNNMNTMKRNKSDTDLELISRQSEEI